MEHHAKFSRWKFSGTEPKLKKWNFYLFIFSTYLWSLDPSLNIFTLYPLFLVRFSAIHIHISTTLWVQASYLDESEGSSSRLKFSAKFSAKVRSRLVSDVWWCLECILLSSFLLLWGKGFVDKQLSAVDSESSVKAVVLTTFTDVSKYSILLCIPKIGKHRLHVWLRRQKATL